MYVLSGSELGEAPSSAPTNCSAISVHRFDKQPVDLQRVLSKSFKDPAEWFDRLDGESKFALTEIFNRMCRYRVWPHVHRILKIGPGEVPVLIADRVFQVPGRTPSVYFMGLGKSALIDALIATRRFCRAQGLGASQHPGQITLREISGSDSLHISLGPGDKFDVHIDSYSPVPEYPGSELCSNIPSFAAITHIGRELVPEVVRKITGIPGFQLLPEPPPPPSGTMPPNEAASPPIVAITAHPRGRTKRPASATPRPVLSADVVARINQAVKQQVNPHALLPSNVPPQEAGNYPDAHEFALDLAGRMEQARRSHVTWVDVNLPQYGSGDFSSRGAIARQILRIAVIVRNYLPDHAKDVHTVVIVFGSGHFATREEVTLP